MWDERGVLRVAVGELGEGCEQGFDAGARHVPELPGENGLPSTGAYRRCEDDLGGVSWGNRGLVAGEPTIVVKVSRVVRWRYRGSPAMFRDDDGPIWCLARSWWW